MTNPYSNSSQLEDRIYSASPAGLTLILLEQAVVSIRAVLASVAEQDPRRRAREVNRVLEILAELTMSLKGDEDPQVRKRKRIYASLQAMLVEAHSQVSVEKFEAVDRTVAVLLQQWNEVCALLDGAASPSSDDQEEDERLVTAGASGYSSEWSGGGSATSRGWTF